MQNVSSSRLKRSSARWLALFIALAGPGAPAARAAVASAASASAPAPAGPVAPVALQGSGGVQVSMLAPAAQNLSLGDVLPGAGRSMAGLRRGTTTVDERGSAS